MTSKEVEKKLNISRANIRYYEKEGLMTPKKMRMNIVITVKKIQKRFFCLENAIFLLRIYA